MSQDYKDRLRVAALDETGVLCDALVSNDPDELVDRAKNLFAEVRRLSGIGVRDALFIGRCKEAEEKMADGVELDLDDKLEREMKAGAHEKVARMVSFAERLLAVITELDLGLAELVPDAARPRWVARGLEHPPGDSPADAVGKPDDGSGRESKLVAAYLDHVRGLPYAMRSAPQGPGDLRGALADALTGF